MIDQVVGDAVEVAARFGNGATGFRPTVVAVGERGVDGPEDALVVRLHQVQLFRGVQQPVAGSQADGLTVPGQQSVAQAVNGADDDAGKVTSVPVGHERGGEPGAHLPGSLLGEGAERQLARLRSTGENQVGGPVGDAGGLAGTGSGKTCSGPSPWAMTSSCWVSSSGCRRLMMGLIMGGSVSALRMNDAEPSLRGANE